MVVWKVPIIAFCIHFPHFQFLPCVYCTYMLFGVAFQVVDKLDFDPRRLRPLYNLSLWCQKCFSPFYHNKHILSSTSPAKIKTLQFFEGRNQILWLFGLKCLILLRFPIALFLKNQCCFFPPSNKHFKNTWQILIGWVNGLIKKRSTQKDKFCLNGSEYVGPENKQKVLL